MIQFYFGFFGWLVIIAITVWLNYFRIEKLKSKPVYFHSNWSRGIFGLACLVLMVNNFDPVGNLHSWVEAAPAIGYIGSSFYLLFDPGLSVKRGKDWDYQGKTSGYFDSLPKWAYLTLKAVSLVILVYSVVKLSDRF